MPLRTPAAASGIGWPREIFSKLRSGNSSTQFSNLLPDRPYLRCRGTHRGSKRVHDGEANCNLSISRYLIEFIADIPPVSSGLASLQYDPGVDSNSPSDRHPETTRHWSTMRCSLWIADNQPDGDG